MTAIVHPGARLGAGVSLGHHVVIDDGVTIGDACVIGHGVIIHAGTVIGARVRIDDHAVIGKDPMRAVRSMTPPPGDLAHARIGDDCIIGTGTVLYRGSRLGRAVMVADLATVRELVTIGDATIIGRGVAVEGPTTVGCRVKLETNAYITAHSTIGDDAFVAPCVATANDNFAGRTPNRARHFRGVTVGRGGRIGVHATVLPGRTVGEDALVAAAALVTHDVPPRQIEAGVPARPFRPVPEDQLLDNQ